MGLGSLVVCLSVCLSVGGVLLYHPTSGGRVYHIENFGYFGPELPLL